MKTASCLSLKWWFLAGKARSSLCSAGHFFGFLDSPNLSMMSILRRISFLKSKVETFLGKLGNKGLGCMENFYKKTAYILSNAISHLQISIHLGKPKLIKQQYLELPCCRYRLFRLFTLMFLYSTKSVAAIEVTPTSPISKSALSSPLTSA
jgi:hypothetical protein